MIRQLIQPLEPSIKKLDFIHRYGGVARTASRKVSTDDMFSKFATETFPISSTLNERECWADGKYLQLCPDDRFYSVSFFEEVNGMQFDGYTTRKSNRRSFPVFSGKLRFVCWMNYQKLGLDETEYSSQFALSLIGAMNKRLINFKCGFDVIEAEYKVSQIEPQTKNPFDKYSFQDIGQLLLYPFGYVSLILDVKAMVSPECFKGVELLTPIDCVEV